VTPAPWWLGCEVQDFTVAPDGAVDWRRQNEAARTELARRGLPAPDPSGELVGWAIRWANTCGGYVDEPGTL
jgi:hypothetical protein